MSSACSVTALVASFCTRASPRKSGKSAAVPSFVTAAGQGGPGTILRQRSGGSMSTEE